MGAIIQKDASTYLVLASHFFYNYCTGMKKKIFLLCFIINLCIPYLFAQNAESLPRPFKTVNVPRGDRSLTINPSNDSEKIRYDIEISKDSTFFSLRVDEFEKGVHKSKGVFDILVYKHIVYKGNKFVFEMIPDVSGLSNMILFTYFPGMSSSTPLLKRDDTQQIKYKKFKDADQSKQSWIPLLLCYVDDGMNMVENLLEYYSKDGHISITEHEEVQNRIFNNIEKYAIVYYDLSDE